MPEQCIAAICCARLRDALWARSLFFLPATPKPPWPACLAMPAFHTTTWLPAPPHPGCLQYGSLPKGTPQWNQTIATLLAGAVSYPGALPSPALPLPRLRHVQRQSTVGLTCRPLLDCLAEQPGHRQRQNYHHHHGEGAVAPCYCLQELLFSACGGAAAARAGIRAGQRPVSAGAAGAGVFCAGLALRSPDCVDCNCHGPKPPPPPVTEAQNI